MEQELPEEVAGLLVPMLGQAWLLPSVAVAEVIPLRQPDRPGRGADWLLGWLSWRNQDVPLISVERLNARGQGSIGRQARIGIFNNGNASPRFFAVIVQGAPQPLRVVATALEALPDDACGAAESMCVRLNDQPAVIPNLDYISQKVTGLTSL